VQIIMRGTCSTMPLGVRVAVLTVEHNFKSQRSVHRLELNGGGDTQGLGSHAVTNPRRPCGMPVQPRPRGGQAPFRVNLPGQSSCQSLAPPAHRRGTHKCQRNNYCGSQLPHFAGIRPRHSAFRVTAQPASSCLVTSGVRVRIRRQSEHLIRMPRDKCVWHCVAT
jgi:hypothetical protein